MSKISFFGLSLSERLEQAGTFEEFSQAVKSGDTLTMSKLLLQIDYSQDSAKAIIDTFLQNPAAFDQ